MHPPSIHNNPIVQQDPFGTVIVSEFRNDYHFLSNFFPATLIWKDVEFPTSEHAYQWAKTLIPEEQDYILYNIQDNGNGPVKSPTTPGQAKRRGTEVHLRDDWNQIKVEVMREILLAKFTQNWGLRQKLLATEDAFLIEGNTWHDNYWGSCVCKPCGNKGSNVLGALLMSVRTALKGPSALFCHGCPICDE